ncbi:carboxypeptidase regulatory-like domain-containing protein [Hymenobacter properus]|uniref:Carboxypeptidase regulatory-like domain-containing protein n=1 Tax=Hymenobacter properus TaxID=2791026 RepID=A0A931FKL7_9BACT|nr:carboxypeptidase regulatory-like domain-containing protein [Hymenobacter properus]MBF9141840.1 carboxypeptidase regulatory-like domain-containing protein [Hymenobacter properus]MBR7720648.1 carboxypeptidase regulatory-like domain-containing protein [Microvirga sp. SRT04]
MLLSVAGFVSCNSERVTSSPSSLRGQEEVRFRAAPGSAPVLVGRVQVVDEAGRFPVAKALVSIDGQAHYTDAFGAYRVPVAPGKHQVVVEHTGMRPARTTVKVEPGDSVQVTFYLRHND